MDSPLGKRDEADLSRHQLEQSSVEEGSGGSSGSASERDSAKLLTSVKIMSSEICLSLIEEKLQSRCKWPADLKKKKKKEIVAEVSIESKLQTVKVEKPKKDEPISVKKSEDAVLSLANRKKIERWEMMHEEEQMAKEKLIRRDNPFKLKNYTIEDIYYPEDFLVRGLFSLGPKMKSRRYIDLRTELAFPLSQNNILRNENVIDISLLEGRLYKYLDETDTVKTLQFMGSASEELVFVDLHTNRRARLLRGYC